MKKHKWEIISVSGFDVGEFWHCFDCGSAGGPIKWGDGSPGAFRGLFLAGTGLGDLPDDCDEACLCIDDFIAKYPEYKELAVKERSRGAVLKPVKDVESIYAPTLDGECPVCHGMMYWEGAGPPGKSDWCDDCRDAMAELLSGSHSSAERFRADLVEIGVAYRWIKGVY